MSLFSSCRPVRRSSGPCPCDCPERGAAVLRRAMPYAVDLARSLLRLRAFRDLGPAAAAPLLMEEQESASREMMLVNVLEPARELHGASMMCAALMDMAVRDASVDLHWLTGVQRAVHELSREDWGRLLRRPS